jgi:hypothetical protein
MVVAYLFLLLLLREGLSTDSQSALREEQDLSQRYETCTYQYALLAKDEPISFLVSHISILENDFDSLRKIS